MEVEIRGYGTTEKRWHAKVVQRAAAVLNEELAKVRSVEFLELWADFDSSAGDVVQIIARQAGGDVFNSVVFKTSDWRTVDDGVPNALAQLRFVVLAMRPALGTLLSPTDISGRALSVRRSTEVLTDMPGAHRTLAFSQATADTRFFAYLDALERALESRRLGSVTGTGCGALGWCVDLVTDDVDECISLARAIAKTHALGPCRVL